MNDAEKYLEKLDDGLFDIEIFEKLIERNGGQFRPNRIPIISKDVPEKLMTRIRKCSRKYWAAKFSSKFPAQKSWRRKAGKSKFVGIPAISSRTPTNQDIINRVDHLFYRRFNKHYLMNFIQNCIETGILHKVLNCLSDANQETKWRLYKNSEIINYGLRYKISSGKLLEEKYPSETLETDFERKLHEPVEL